LNLHQTIKQFGRAAARFRSQLPYLPKAFSLVYRAASGLTVVWLLLLLIQGILPVAMVYLTKILVDGVAAMINTGGEWQALFALMPAITAMAVVLISIEIMQSVSRWLRTAQSEKCRIMSTG